MKNFKPNHSIAIVIVGQHIKCYKVKVLKITELNVNAKLRKM